MTQYILKIIRTSCPQVHKGEVLTEFYMPGKNTIGAMHQSPGTNIIPQLYDSIEDALKAKGQLQKKLDKFKLKLILNNQVNLNVGMNDTLIVQELFATIAVWDYAKYVEIQNFNKSYTTDLAKKIRVAEKMHAKAERFLALQRGEKNYIGNEEIDSI